jgi:hypothetical protein
MAKPKAADIYERAKACIERNADRDALYDRLDALYDQTRIDQANDEGSESGVVLVQMPYATNVIDFVTDLASQINMALEVPAQKETSSAKQTADDTERWLQAWVRANERAQQKNIIQDAAWHASMRSFVVLRCLYMDSLVQETGEGDDKSYTSDLPLLLQVRDPRHTYFQESAVGLKYVVEAWSRPASEIRYDYPGALLSESDDDDEIEWVEYWDDKYRCYFADGEPVKIKGQEVIAHGYGCCPYSIGVARTTPRSGDKRFRPMLASSESTLRNLDTWFSILTTAGHDSVTNAWGIFSDDYSANGEKQLDLSPDAINYLGPNDKVTPLQRSPLPADFFQLGTLLHQAFQTSTFPFSVYGQMSAAVAGYALNLAQQAGRRPLIPVWQAIERAFEGAFANCITICRNKVVPLVGDSVPLTVIAAGDSPDARRVRRSIALKPKAWGKDFEVFVSLSDPMPQDEAQNLRMALEATQSQKPLLSVETARTKYKIAQDSNLEQQRIMIENVVQQLAQFEGIKLARERGYIPNDVQLPPGFTAMQGNLIPEALLPKPPPQQKPSDEDDNSPPNMGANPAEMQMLAGTGQPQNLSEMAGTPPPMPQMPGGM